MMKKKLLSILLTLVMCFSLAACGGDDRLKELKDLFNQVVEPYNEALTLAQENGWMADEVTQTELNTMSAVLDPLGEMLSEGGSELTDEDYDAFTKLLEEWLPAMDELVQRVSVPYEE